MDGEQIRLAITFYYAVASRGPSACAARAGPVVARAFLRMLQSPPSVLQSIYMADANRRDEARVY